MKKTLGMIICTIICTATLIGMIVFGCFGFASQGSYFQRNYKLYGDGTAVLSAKLSTSAPSATGLSSADLGAVTEAYPDYAFDVVYNDQEPHLDKTEPYRAASADYFDAGINSKMAIDDAICSKYGFTLVKGKLPSNVTEAAISLYTYECLVDRGYGYGDKWREISSYDHILGVPLTNEKTIVGIVDTHVDKTFDILKTKDPDSLNKKDKQKYDAAKAVSIPLAGTYFVHKTDIEDDFDIPQVNGRAWVPFENITPESCYYDGRVAPVSIVNDRGAAIKWTKETHTLVGNEALVEREALVNILYLKYDLLYRHFNGDFSYEMNEFTDQLIDELLTEGLEIEIVTDGAKVTANVVGYFKRGENPALANYTYILEDARYTLAENGKKANAENVNNLLTKLKGSDEEELFVGKTVKNVELKVMNTVAERIMPSRKLADIYCFAACAALFAAAFVTVVVILAKSRR